MEEIERVVLEQHKKYYDLAEKAKEDGDKLAASTFAARAKLCKEILKLII